MSVIALRSIPAFVRLITTKAGMKRSEMTECSYMWITKNDTLFSGESLSPSRKRKIAVSLLPF